MKAKWNRKRLKGKRGGWKDYSTDFLRPKGIGNIKAYKLEGKGRWASTGEGAERNDTRKEDLRGGVGWGRNVISKKDYFHRN